jgi:hypothetical protein
MKFAISPIHKNDDFPSGLNIENKIDVFSARVEGWQLGIALALKENNLPPKYVPLLMLVQPAEIGKDGTRLFQAQVVDIRARCAA